MGIVWYFWCIHLLMDARHPSDLPSGFSTHLFVWLSYFMTDAVVANICIHIFVNASWSTTNYTCFFMIALSNSEFWTVSKVRFKNTSALFEDYSCWSLSLIHHTCCPIAFVQPPKAEIFSPGTGGHRLLGRWYLFIRGREAAKNLNRTFPGRAFLGLEVKSVKHQLSPKNQPKLPSTSCFILAENVDFIDGFSKFRIISDSLTILLKICQVVSPFSQAWLGCQVEKHVQKTIFGDTNFCTQNF